jgi:hypothetical protein
MKSTALKRSRSNVIKIVESGGSRLFTHKEKERVFTKIYMSILVGQTAQPLIDLGGVYPDQMDLAALSRSFTEQEIYKALKQIPRDKSS